MANHLDRIGQLVGDYRLLRRLGGGGFGHVYLAEQVRDHSQVAIKLLHVQLGRSEELKAFINEASTIRLKHAHIVPLLDFGISPEDIPYLVMEYATQGTLRDRYPKGSQIPLAQVVNYVRQVASALQYAHEQRLIHRDVKPQNMLLRSDGTVLLSDFGLVTIAHSSDSLSLHQEAVGTIAYMAPEQIQKQAQAASDQYSLGVVVYEWIAGRCPFEGTSTEIAVQHVMKPPPSLVAQVPGLSRTVEEVVLKALAKDLKDRFATVQDFTAALEQAVQGTPAMPDKYETYPIESLEQVLSSDLINLPVSSSWKSPTLKRRVDWGDALIVPIFYGREQEQTQLTQWVVQERCRVASVLGMGGIGKSALVMNVAHQLAEGTVSLTSPFEVVIVRSLRDAPSCEALLDGCVQVLSQQPLNAMSMTFEERISLLLSCLREVRALIVLDNVEDLLLAGDVKGQFRPEFEGYGLLLRRVAETEHQSCLLLTSREKPAELRLLAGKYSSVRTLRLTGLDISACKQILEEKELVGTQEDMERLSEIYVGNPLALKIVARTIVDLFGGEINPFLDSGIVVFGSITDLLDEQFARLSALEQSVLCWLAIMREPVTLDELSALLVTHESSAQVLEAIDAGYRRSLIERGKRRGSFTLQSVVLEYVTAVLVTKACDEIRQRRLDRLIQYGLSQAHTKEYVRQTQERLLLSPLLRKLRSVYLGQVNETEQEPQKVERKGTRNGTSPFPTVEKQLLSLLDQLRKEADDAQGYGPANLIALLRLLRGDLSGLDLSHLSIRGVYLQGIEMQDASLVGTTLRDAIFTEAFNVITAVAASCDGKLWAAGTLQGEVRVWREGSQSLHLVWQAHTDILWTLAFSPDGRSLVTVSYDGTVKLWDLEQGGLLWTGWHTDIVICLAFSPDGCMLASCGDDAVVRLWDVTSGTNLQTLSGDGSRLFSLAWSPDGSLLASGSFDGSIRLWHLRETRLATYFATLTGHTHCVWALAFAPDGTQLVSGSWDNTVKLWEVESLHLRQTLMGHTERVFTVAWSGDGRVIASAGFDKTICVFDVEQGSYRAALHGHTAVVYGIAFTPDSRGLLSGSEDGTVRVWDIASGQCVRVVEGCAIILHDVAWSPDSTRLASAGTDTLVTIWDVTGVARPKVLRGHSWHLFGVVWSPDGQMLASSGRDNAIRLWNPVTGECRQVLRDPDHNDTMFYGIAWSPDGRLLACGSLVRGVQVWNMETRTRCWVGQHHRIRRLAWSPDGTRLAGSGDDGNVCLWEASDGTMIGKLQGHSGRVMSVDWSPDGTRLVSGSGGQDGGELFIWDMGSHRACPDGELVQTLKGHPDSVFAVVWSPAGEVLVSGGSDGTIRWWDVETAECLRILKGHEGGVWSLRVSPDGRLLASCGNDNTIRVWDLQSAELLRTLRHDRPYERLNITEIRGLNRAQRESLQALGAFDEGTGS